jgi:hypothetical protein
VIQRLVPTKGLGVVDKALWSDIIIPQSTKVVTLGLAAREASTSARVGVSCQCKGPCNTGGVGAIRKVRSVVYTAIEMSMIVVTYQV